MTSPTDEPVLARWSTVILRHDLPDGSSHFDWMFQPPPGFPQDSSSDGSMRLVTFRCEFRPDELKPGTAQAINRLPDHRDLYLTYEGSVPGERGVVMRVREGQITDCLAVPADGGDGWELTMEWLEGNSRQETRVIQLFQGFNGRWMAISARQNTGGVSH